MASPSPNTTSTEKKTHQPGRRALLNKIWALLACIAGFEFLWVSASIRKDVNENKTSGPVKKVVQAGTVDSFATSSVTAIPEGQFYLVRQKDGSFLALSKQCTHLGCTLSWDNAQEKFICPCHGSTYTMAGDVLTPPAQYGLDNFPIRVEDGMLLVDISAPQKWRDLHHNRSTQV